MVELLSNIIECSNPSCTVAETGKCFEGLNPDSCPHCQSSSNSGDSDNNPEIQEINDCELTDIATEVNGLNNSDINICSGNCLSIDEATEILCSGKSRVMAMVGPSDSGKTTLGLSIYQAFHNGPYHNWSFGGSKTLFALEERCHLSRVACGQSKPETLRTSIDSGLQFIHLAISGKKTGLVNLLLSERSGELYKTAVEKEGGCQDLYEIKRADSILFLVDGKKLSDNGERHASRTNLMMTIRALLHESILYKAHHIGIVLTKFDLISENPKKDTIVLFFEKIVDNIRKSFGEELSGIRSFIIAARHDNETIEPRYGVHEILDEVLLRCPASTPCLRPELTCERFFWGFNRNNEGANGL